MSSRTETAPPSTNQPREPNQMRPGVCSTCGGRGVVRQGGYYQGQIQEWNAPCPGCCKPGFEQTADQLLGRLLFRGVAVALLVGVIIGGAVALYELATGSVLLPSAATTAGVSRLPEKTAYLQPGASGLVVGGVAAVAVFIVWFIASHIISFVVGTFAMLREMMFGR